MANVNDGIFDGSIADGWTDKWSNEEKQKFMEDWLNDSFLFDESMEESDDTTDADSDVCIKRQKKTKTILDSESQDNDSEINPNATASENPDDDTEEIISTRRKKRKREIFFDSDSQGNDSNVYQLSAAASSVCENSDADSDVCIKRRRKTKTILDSESQDNDSEINPNATASENPETSTAEDLPRVIILDSQSSQDDMEQPCITFRSPMRTHSSGVNRLHDRAETSGKKHERDDDDDDDDYSEDVDDGNSTNSDQCYPKRQLEKEFTTYLQYMLSYCLDQEFLDDANSQDDLKIAKVKIETKMQDLENMLKSEAWQSGFAEAMETFPILQCSTVCPHEGCEACARPGRIASKILTFKGSPYDIENFESQETSLPSQMSFEVGRQCAERSTLYHRVFHYRFHLREQCVEAVNQFSETKDVTTEFVLNKCMDDEKWRKEKHRDFYSLIDNVTKWFATINKSANWKS